MKRTELIVVRHGETAWNAERKFQGHLDSRLTSKGLSQARALAARLPKQRFSALYSSDLGRAVQTAQIISTAIGLDLVTDARLRERNLGVFQGLGSEEIKARYPAEYRLYQSRDPNYVVPGGESLRQQVERNVSCLEELAERYAGESFLVVTHGGVLSGLFRHVLSIPLETPRRFEFVNGGVNVFTFGAGYWTLRTWGDVSHLDDETD